MRSSTIHIPLLAILVWLAGAAIFASCSQATIPPTTIIPAESPIPSLAPVSPTAELQATPTQQTQEATASSDLASSYLVIEFASTDRLVRRIDFTQPITGVTALQTAGRELRSVDFGDSGTAVCSIDGIGCPPEDCFCNSKYWSYENWLGDAWEPYPSGPSGVTVSPGAIEGWRWGEFGKGSLPPAPALVAAARTYERIREQQDTITGGYDSASSSIEVLLALGANHLEAGSWQLGDNDPTLLDYWLENASTYSAEGPANAGKLAVALAATGTCWPEDAIQPSIYMTGTVGIYSPHAGFQAWAMLGTAALSQTIPLEAVDYLKSLAQPDGGWEWNQGFASDTNTTALVVETLIAAGEPADSPVITRAIQYLKSAQNADGGFPYVPDSPYGSDSDVNSTAYVIQAILAANQSPFSATWTVGETNPIDYLLGMQLKNGGFEWQTGSGENLVAGAQAAASLLGRVFPLAIANLPACP
jgi:hypothetical protein